MAEKQIVSRTLCDEILYVAICRRCPSREPPYPLAWDLVLEALALLNKAGNDVDIPISTKFMKITSKLVQQSLSLIDEWGEEESQ